MNSNIKWKMCCAAVVLIAAMALSPMVIAPNKIEPSLFGMPYTLWLGILISIVLWVITYIGYLNHPGRKE